MVKKQLLYISFIATLFVGCTEEIPLDLPVEDQQIVVNGLLSNDHPPRLYLGKTISISDTLYPTVDQARVALVNDENGQLIDSLPYEEEGYYEGRRALTLFNTPLRLQVAVDGQQVSARTYIPAPVQLLSAQEIWPSGYDEYGDGLTEYRVSFQDAPEEKNYYELFFFYYTYNEDSQRENNSFYSNQNLAYVDPVIRAEGLEEYGNKSLLFSDQLFDGETAQIVVKYLPLVSDGEVRSLIDTTFLKSQKGYALLRSVSKEYYDYRKAWTIHRYTQQREPTVLQEDPIIEDFTRFLFIGDPVEMSNAIEGGIGVFAGYSQTIREVEKL